MNVALVESVKVGVILLRFVPRAASISTKWLVASIDVGPVRSSIVNIRISVAELNIGSSLQMYNPALVNKKSKIKFLVTSFMNARFYCWCIDP